MAGSVGGCLQTAADSFAAEIALGKHRSGSCPQKLGGREQKMERVVVGWLEPSGASLASACPSWIWFGLRVLGLRLAPRNPASHLKAVGPGRLLGLRSLSPSPLYFRAIALLSNTFLSKLSLSSPWPHHTDRWESTILSLSRKVPECLGPHVFDLTCMYSSGHHLLSSGSDTHFLPPRAQVL